MSTRMIGGVIMTHGDDKGLVLPPKLAPHQVVIVPIARGEAADAVLAAAHDLARRLKSAGIRAHVDDRTHVSPGFKFNDWEMRGAPLRLEIGPRDLAAGTALLARRLGDEGKTAIGLDTAPETLKAALDRFQTFLLKRATDFRESQTATVDSWPRVQGEQWPAAGRARCTAASRRARRTSRPKPRRRRAACPARLRPNRAPACDATRRLPTASASCSAAPTDGPGQGLPRGDS